MPFACLTNRANRNNNDNKRNGWDFMPRRSVISRDELFFVADRMVAEGKQVTALAILASLGGGSLTTIYKYLEEWESGRQSKSSLEQHRSSPHTSQPTGVEMWRELKLEVDQLRTEVTELKGYVQSLREQNADLLGILASQKQP
jgi:hypothetical protein